MLPVALAASLSLAPPALADQADDAFVSALTAHGIIPNSLTADQALINGHAICVTMEKGIGQADMVGAVASSDHLSTDDAGFVVGAATAAFCPDYDGT
ncbi:hypothetical protein BH09ACT8_BH09ACT8_20550 [soil metagenome]